jgi:hypothetical protein
MRSREYIYGILPALVSEFRHSFTRFSSYGPQKDAGYIQYDYTHFRIKDECHILYAHHLFSFYPTRLHIYLESMKLSKLSKTGLRQTVAHTT